MDIEVRELFELEDKVLVDIRSPSEYEEFHIPGAVNVPLFEDEEKRLIGLLYRREGVEKAKELGYQIANSKLSELIQSFRRLKERHRHVVVYCWRGGLRSQELCKVLNSFGIEVLRLKGGYRAYRQYILQHMERLLEDKSFLVLTGKTGVGKTELLKRLEEEGYPVINLEELARDRGSVFGRVGIRDRVSQKLFDALLYERLRSIDSPLIIVEDESRTIGKVHIPEAFWKRKEEGFFVEVIADLKVRVRHVLEEYVSAEGWKEEAKSSLFKIRKYLGEEKFKRALLMLEEERIEELAEFLMVDYYDRTYRLSRKPIATIDCTSMEDCLEKLKELYSHLLKEGVAHKPAL